MRDLLLVRSILLILLFLSQAWANAFEIYAHRGGSSIYPENTLEAVLDGLKKGAAASEFDIHLTKDDQFILSHDPVIDTKKCNSPEQDSFASLIIKELTLEEILTFTCHLKGGRSGKIATLEEVLIATNHEQMLSVEVKYNDRLKEILYSETHHRFYASISHISNTLEAILAKHNAHDRVVIQSFSEKLLAAIKNTSSVKTSFLYKGRFLLSKRVGMKKKDFVKKNSSKLWIPSFWNAKRIMKKRDFDYLSPSVGQITHKFYAKKFDKNISSKLDELDFKIAIWTVNDVEKAEAFRGIADVIITDKPELFIE